MISCQYLNLSVASFRYIMIARVTDKSGETYISAFNEEAERLIGCSADELGNLRSQVTYWTPFSHFGMSHIVIKLIVLVLFRREKKILIRLN